MVASVPSLRLIQTHAVGIGGMLYPEMIESPVVITTARGVRARAIAEHVLGACVALARQFPVALRRQVAHQRAQDRRESRTAAIITLLGHKMGMVGLAQ